MNSTGTQVIDDIRIAIQNSSSKSIEDLCTMNYSDAADINNCKKSDAYYLRREISTVKMPEQTNTLSDMPVYGAFCTGTYSYIWNSGYLFMDGAEVGKGKVSVKYKDMDGNERVASDFRLLKIKDEMRQICIKGVKNNSYDISDGNYVKEEPVDLLASVNSANNLAIYDLRAAKPAEGASKENLFYSGWLILGTTSGGPTIKGNTKCANPDEAGSSFDYCAINRFSFAAQASGEK